MIHLFPITEKGQPGRKARITWTDRSGIGREIVSDFLPDGATDEQFQAWVNKLHAAHRLERAGQLPNRTPANP